MVAKYVERLAAGYLHGAAQATTAAERAVGQ